MTILDKIVETRKRRLSREGSSLGVEIPVERLGPVLPFCRTGTVICEVKRRSPSRGDIRADLDPVEMVRRYVQRGVTTVSVLTEMDFFAGSLNDLIRIKRAFPRVAVLRKDFLLNEEDIDVSYRAGADAVLLIASVLERDSLKVLLERCAKWGLTALVEAHTEEEIHKMKPLKPELVGINSRDLATFKIDKIGPLRVAASVKWECRLVYESGIFSREDVALAVSSGFDSVLVGEAAVRNPELVSVLIAGLSDSEKLLFWRRLYEGYNEGKPLVKICGVTNSEDFAAAAAMGADLVGFIFAESPRRTSSSFVKSLGRPGGGPLRAAVVVTGISDSPESPPMEVRRLLEDGYLDVVQFHGDESPAVCTEANVPYYRALQLQNVDGVDQIETYRCPRILVDAFSSEVRGGTGRRIDSQIAQVAKNRRPLWLAGGINPDNVAEIIRSLSPELIDASSGLESAPGKKDHNILKSFFETIRSAAGDNR